MTLLIDSASLWLVETNAFVVADAPGGAAVVIDAPPDPTGIGDLLAKHDLTPVATLLTHGHIDHVGGIDGVAGPTVTAYIHPYDIDMARHPADQLRVLFGAQVPEVEEDLVTTVFVDLEADTTLELAGIAFDILFTPGHTPGHCCFHVPEEGVVFSGDTLFAGSVGRTDLPGGSHEEMMKSMATEILTLPGDTRVMPGHGPNTTIAAELRTNPFLQEMP